MRKNILVPAAALAAAAVAYGGAWFVTATTVRDETLLWLTARRQDGFTITTDPPVLAGFPLRAEAVFANLTVSAPPVKDSPPWSWHMGALRIYAHPLGFGRFFIDLAGEHIVSGVSPDLAFVLQAQHAEIAVTQDKNAPGLDIQMAGIAAPGFTLDKAVIAVRTEGALVHLGVTAQNAMLPDILPPPLSRNVQDVALSLDIMGPLTTRAPLPDVLEAWRTGGGTLEVRDVAIDWPPVSAKGSGTITLDHALQPEGAFTATFHGFMDVVDILVAAGRMDNKQAAVARGALVLLARTPGDGAAPELSLSLTLQNRHITAGPVTLMEMPRIVWPKNVVIP